MKNDSDKISVACERDCGYKVYAAQIKGSESFLIKSIKGLPHNCPWSLKNKSVNSTWIANKFKYQIVSDPSWGLKGFRKAVRNRFTVNVSVKPS